MVEGNIVLDSVKKMLESGLDEGIIKATLQDIGLSEKEINAVIQQAKGGSAVPSQQKTQDFHEAVAEKTAEKVKTAISEEAGIQAIQQSATQTALEEHSEKLENVGFRVDELHEKIDSLGNAMPSDAFEKLSSLQSRIDLLTADVKELKAGSNALADLMKKILEANRNILSQLEGKRK
jgi:hypothetical protein